MKQCVREPTRENSILDLILTKNIDIINEVQVKENFSTSDHKIVKFNILVKAKRIKQPKAYRRELLNRNFIKLNQSISLSQLESHINFKFTVNQKYQAFMNELLKMYNNDVPIRPLNKIIKNWHHLEETQ